jgi:hypothetical protein
LAEAARTLQPGFKPADYTFIGGTEGDDNFTDPATGGPDVFCGFGGDRDVINILDEGDIFLGGAGIDDVDFNRGTFYGGEGDDLVNINEGTFNGGAGNDQVFRNFGTFFGEEGFDQVSLGNPPVDGP